MNRIAIAALLVGIFALAGCSALSDYKRGKEIRRQNPATDQQIKDTASTLGKTAGTALPPLEMPVTILVGTVLTWWAGRKDRKGMPPSARPVTGWLGSKTGFEWLIQNGANVLAGLFNHGKPGGPARTALLVAGSGAIGWLLTHNGLALRLLNEPALQNILWIPLAAAIAAGVKVAEQVRPVEPSAPPAPPTT